MTRERRSAAGLIVFTVLCFLSSWVVAATLRVFDVQPSGQRFGTRLLSVSMHYLVTMGWQPIAATWFVRRFIEQEPEDMALRPCRTRFTVIGTTTALALATAATILAVLFARIGLSGVASLNGPAAPSQTAAHRSGLDLASLLIGTVVALALVWAQALAEEIGWRGYLLPTAMRHLGRWRGLVFQGAVWGVWYGPVVFFSTYGRAAHGESLLRCASFAISCILVGILLGWLRLASGSVVPVITANLTLTLIAGMPYVVHGIDGGLRSAIFRPEGWIVLSLALALLLASRFRALVRLPPEHASPEGLAFRHLFLLFDSRRDRTLH